MTRLYCSEHLLENGVVSLTEDHVHYVRNVLRYTIGDSIHIFNEKDGEWSGQINLLTKSKAEIKLIKHLRLPQSERKLTLIFCPIKNDALHYLIEKCTEIGVSDFQPVIMQHGNIHKINQEKLQRIAIEAAQQCERLSIPTVHPLKKLGTIIGEWDQKNKIYACLERHPDLEKPKFYPDSAIFIGPEGGFHQDEVTFLKNKAFVIPLSLGDNILRAETAAVVASALILV